MVKVKPHSVGYATVPQHAVNENQFKYTKQLGNRESYRRHQRLYPMPPERPVLPASRAARAGAMGLLGGLVVGLLVLIKRVCS